MGHVNENRLVGPSFLMKSTRSLYTCAGNSTGDHRHFNITVRCTAQCAGATLRFPFWICFVSTVYDFHTLWLLGATHRKERHKMAALHGCGWPSNATICAIIFYELLRRTRRDAQLIYDDNEFLHVPARLGWQLCTWQHQKGTWRHASSWWSKALTSHWWTMWVLYVSFLCSLAIVIFFKGHATIASHYHKNQHDLG